MSDEDQHGLHRLPDATYGLEVRFPPGMPESVQRLMAVLGVRVVFDERAPRRLKSRPYAAKK